MLSNRIISRPSGRLISSQKIMPEVTAWQNRPLEKVYPFIFMDAIHYKVKEDHRYVTKAAYVVLGITMDGRKDILGVWIGEHESSKFWLSVLNDLKWAGFPVRRRVLSAPPAGTGQTFGGRRKEAFILDFGPGSICAYCDDFPAPKIDAGKTICE